MWGLPIFIYKKTVAYLGVEVRNLVIISTFWEQKLFWNYETPTPKFNFGFPILGLRALIKSSWQFATHIYIGKSQLATLNYW
jgi:hypothetical protein